MLLWSYGKLTANGTYPFGAGSSFIEQRQK